MFGRMKLPICRYIDHFLFPIHIPTLQRNFPLPGLPVENVLQPNPELGLELKNGHFEDAPTEANRMPEWSWQDEPGIITFWDTDVAQSGSSSLRVSNAEHLI